VPIYPEELIAENHDEYIKKPRDLPDCRPGLRGEKLYQKIEEIESELKKLESFSNRGDFFPLNAENEPPCISAILENRKVSPGKCDFNQSMMTITRWFQTNGIGYREAMTDARFADFVYQFPSGSLKTPQDRKNNVRDRLASMERAGAEFGCGYAKSLGIKLGCDHCSVYVTEIPLEGTDILTEEAREAAKEYREKDSKRVGPLNLDILPKKVKHFIEEGVKRQDGEPLLLLPPVLASAAAALERRVFFQWHGNNSFLYCNLYQLTIAGSGTGKTTALNSGARDIRQINRQQQKAIKDEEQKNPQDESVIQEMKKKLVILPERVTLEALVAIMNEHNGVIFSAEFSGFLKSLKAGGNAFGMLEVVSDIYDCTYDGWNKATVSGGLLTLDEPCLSICGYTTLDFVRGELSKTDVGSGALARYLLYYPPSEDLPPTLPKPLSPMSEMTIYQAMADLDPLEMALSKEAKLRAVELFTIIFEDIKSHGKQAGNFLEPFVRRWTAHLIKIGMILQQFERVNSNIIQIDALEGAWHIVQLAMESTKLLFDEKLGIGEHREKCNRVMGYLAKKGGMVTRSQILKNQVLQGGVKELDYILETLIHSGRIASNGDNLKPGTLLYMKKRS
jgi:hypothetical protein